MTVLNQGLNQIETLAEMFAANDRIFEHVATIYFKLYNAFLAKGFSEEQAIKIVASLPIFKF
jgi:hypothetical protein